MFRIHTPDTTQASKASIQFDFYKTFIYDHISIMYSSAHPFNVKCFDNKNKIISEDSIAASNTFTIQPLSIGTNHKRIQFDFNVTHSPDFYGFLIDGKGGVQIDNYAIRGHSGERMLYADADYLAKQLKKLNTKLLILQYGANVVPYFDTEKKCNYLENVYYNLFIRYKKTLPGVSILIIGPGDMAYVKDGAYVSYQNVPMVRDAQKRAALRAGCAFWDMYEAMGGGSSVLTWSNKGLASRDGHFYTGGQRMVAKQLFDALMIEYNNYLYRQIHTP